jgi:hypothetical protein
VPRARPVGLARQTVFCARADCPGGPRCRR